MPLECEDCDYGFIIICFRNDTDNLKTAKTQLKPTKIVDGSNIFHEDAKTAKSSCRLPCQLIFEFDLGGEPSSTSSRV